MEGAPTKRNHLHIVVGDVNVHPSKNPLTQGGWFETGILTEFSLHKSHWEYPFDDYARRKGYATWREQTPSRQLVTLSPHLLESGDIEYFGSAVVDQIVVAASGVEPYFDELFSTCIAYALRAACIHKYLSFKKDNEPYFV